MAVLLLRFHAHTFLIPDKRGGEVNYPLSAGGQNRRHKKTRLAGRGSVHNSLCVTAWSPGQWHDVWRYDHPQNRDRRTHTVHAPSHCAVPVLTARLAQVL